ncbi:MAG: hypothetical protein EZS28_014812 [Streblomastix strix]|uniref:Uncharacterized protein n=1 Tax=Streblomastix strix TaxID=222440 RepID=A0A5J4W4L6_9EUKA|nr:MAG: hypothetical protein EZS28_014812 [Streblomastix strix]
MMRRTVSLSEDSFPPQLERKLKESNILEDQEDLKNLPVPDKTQARNQFRQQINGKYLNQNGAIDSGTSPQDIVGVKQVASLIGELNFLRFQFKQISLYINALNLFKRKAAVKGSWNCQVQHTKRILRNFYKLLQLIALNRPIELIVKNPLVILTTDAQEIGLGDLVQISNGKLMDAEEYYGNWNLKSSNQREMAAYRNRVLPKKLDTSQSISSHCQDNVPIVGESQCVLSDGAHKWYSQYQSRCVEQNGAHEDYSMSIPTLNQAITFLQLVPTIDLYASLTMKLCERYCSPQHY